MLSNCKEVISKHSSSIFTQLPLKIITSPQVYLYSQHRQRSQEFAGHDFSAESLVDVLAFLYSGVIVELGGGGGFPCRFCTAFFFRREVAHPGQVLGEHQDQVLWLLVAVAGCLSPLLLLWHQGWSSCMPNPYWISSQTVNLTTHVCQGAMQIKTSRTCKQL